MCVTPFSISWTLNIVIFIGYCSHMMHGMTEVTVKVLRDKDDVVDYKGNCSTIQAKINSGHEGNCICNGTQGTLMSVDFAEFLCWSLADMNCDISLGDKNQPYLISGDINHIKTHPALNESCATIKNILVWNIVFEQQGNWADVTINTTEYFDISRNSKLSIFDFNMTLWSGQTFKINFGCGKCTIVKMKGKIEYPFDMSLFYRPVSTAKPIQTTTSSSRPSTEHHLQTSTRGKTSLESSTKTSSSSSTSSTNASTTFHPSTTFSTTLHKKSKKNLLSPKVLKAIYIILSFFAFLLLLFVIVWKCKERSRATVVPLVNKHTDGEDV